mgnify:CR=1 FL=1
MKNRVIVDSLIISFVAAAAIKFAYGVENIYAVLCINIALITGLYFILSSCDKNARAKEKENRGYIMDLLEENIRKTDHLGSIINNGFKQSQVQMEQVISSIDLQTNQNKEKIQRLIAIEGSLNEGNNKTDAVINSIIENSENIKTVYKSILENNDKLEDRTNIDRDNGKILSNIKDDNSRLNMELKTKIDEGIDSNDNIVSKYDLIQKSFTAELLKVAAKNENVTNMLIDNYKILKEVADSI